jgi:hypothetical protein
VLIVADYAETPGKFELAVELTRYTFPYLLFISLVAFLSGVLNSLTRFAIAAFAPALLNIVLIVAILAGPGGETPEELSTTVPIHGRRRLHRRHSPVRDVLGWRCAGGITSFRAAAPDALRSRSW